MISIKEARKAAKPDEENKEKEGEEAVAESKEESTPAVVATSPMDQTESMEGKEKDDDEDSSDVSPIPILEGLSHRERTSLLTSCVGLIGIPVDRDALNAVLRLCLRLTQDFEQATLFTKLGGVKMLLGLNQSSNFNGFASLATLLVRHVMEDPATIRFTMEKVVRSSTVTTNSANTKEIHYLLRVLASAACRAPDLFLELSKDILRVDLALLNKRGVEPEEDPRLLVKSLPPKAGAPSAPPVLQEVSHSVICDLLNFLVQGEPENGGAGGSAAANEETAETAGAGHAPGEAAPAAPAANRTQSVILRNSSSGDLQAGSNNAEAAAAAAAAAATATAASSSNANAKEKKSSPSTPTAEEEAAKRKLPLMTKSAVCRLLAELVKSYGSCAKLITEHVYEAGISENIKEDTTALAYLLDELLISKVDKELGPLIKTLVAALASCNQHSDAQAALVSEVKAALSRALAWPESAQKHLKIQSLTTLVSTMIESCPSSSQQNQHNGLNAYKQQQFAMNNIVKMMLKRNLISDLARVAHSLDLSSPNVASTVNAALKPLEILTRIVNQPTMAALPSRGGAKNRAGAGNAGAAGSGTGDASQATNQGESAGATNAGANGAGTNTTNSEATRAQGDETVEPDPEATEHDISTAAESIEPNSESQLQVRSSWHFFRLNLNEFLLNSFQTVEEGNDEVFDEMMDQLLERDGAEPPPILGEINIEHIDDSEAAQHDSQVKQG